MKYICMEDIENLAAQGKKELVVDENTVLMEFGARYGPPVGYYHCGWFPPCASQSDPSIRPFSASQSDTSIEPFSASQGSLTGCICTIGARCSSQAGRQTEGLPTRRIAGRCGPAGTAQKPTRFGWGGRSTG